MKHSGQGAAAAGRAILNHSADQRRWTQRGTRPGRRRPHRLRKANAPQQRRGFGLMGVGFGPANAEGVVME
jgi:hypothetical protein